MNTLLLDHDNIDFSRVSVRRLLETWIDADPILRQPGPPVALRLRAYGGWFAESASSDARFRAAEMYTEAAPSLIKYAGNFYSVSFEFADSLASAKTVRITNTVVKRASTPTVTAIRGAAACPETDCEIKATRRWLRHSRACGREACPRAFIDHFERVEQKQVDVHLAVDLISMLSTRNDHVGVATDDADVLPAVLAAAATGTAQGRLTLLRFNPRTTYADPYLLGSDVRIATVQP